MPGLGLLLPALSFTFSCYAALLPQSKDFCKPPPPIENAYPIGDWNNETYAPGQLVKYSCFPGYVSFGSIKMVCTQSTWSWVSQRKCEKRSCGHPGDIDFGSFDFKLQEGFKFGSIIEYSCNEGYRMVSKHNTRECTASGWSNVKPICEARLCPPVVDKSLRVVSTVSDDEYTSGQVIYLQCKNPIHTLDGPSEIFCTPNGTWNIDPPTCKGPCIIDKSNMTRHNISANYPRQWIGHNEVIEFKCLPGYEISDPKQLIITCNEETFAYPTCHRKVQEKIKKAPCIEPPEVSFGEYLGRKKQIYDTGNVLQIQCMNYYKLKGKRFIKCRDGVWDNPPVCLEPCVLNINYIQGNNTQLVDAKKRYLKDGQHVLLRCLPKSKISDPRLLKVQCNKGKILYPKCTQSGSQVSPPGTSAGTWCTSTPSITEGVNG